MYSKFPFSLENIPRQKGFGCLTLKIGCIFSGLLIILYTVLALAQCLATLPSLVPGVYNLDNLENVLTYFFAIGVITCHFVTVVLTTLMLIGTLREKIRLMRPWVIWTSCQLMGNLLIIIFMMTVNMVFDHMDENSIVLFIAGFLGLVVRFYMLMLVTSYYKQLEEEGVERLKTLLHNETWNSTA